MAQALSAILDQRNWPMLIHCNKGEQGLIKTTYSSTKLIVCPGKYRVGVITALIRRLQGWSMTSIYEEYARFAGHDRVADEEVSKSRVIFALFTFTLTSAQFIDMFPVETVTFDTQFAPNWLRI